MLQLNEYPIALIVPKLQLSNNQQNTILPFCKTVKFLYSGCKETLQLSCKLGAGYFPIFMNKLEKSIKTS
jgi:hypothetical protein